MKNIVKVFTVTYVVGWIILVILGILLNGIVVSPIKLVLAGLLAVFMLWGAFRPGSYKNEELD